MSKIVLACLAASLLLLAAVASAAPITRSYGPFDAIFYNNGDGDGINTGMQNWSESEMSDIGYCISTWDSLLGNVPGRQIRLHLFWYEFGANGILGGSYSPTNGAGSTGWTYGEHIWRDSANYDGRWDGFDTFIQYDITAAGFSWNIGSGNPLSNQIDFRSVVTHEIGHSIGFYDSYDPNYDDWGNAWGTESNPYDWAGYQGLSTWDQNLIDSAGNRPSNGGYGTPGNFNERDNPVYWRGTNANTYYGGPVPIYAPSTYQGGSSLSHVDETALPNALMSPYVSLGQSVRAPTGVEWEMMQDMGWDVVLVPEPSSLLALGGGLIGMIGFALRRRRS